MSNRFPPIAPQAEFDAARSRARVLTLAQAPSLPWIELALGLALFLLLRGF